MATESLLVLTTCGPSEADRIASTLVERRLAACVNTVSGVVSAYRWKGKVEREQESLLIIKTTSDRYPALEEAIRETSSYELPEVVAVRMAGGSPAYLDWVAGAVGQDSE